MGTVDPHVTIVRSSPCSTTRAVPGRTTSPSASGGAASAGSFRQVFGYRKTVGLPPARTALSSPAASAAVLGITTSRPGTWPSVASWVAACHGPRPGR